MFQKSLYFQTNFLSDKLTSHQQFVMSPPQISNLLIITANDELAYFKNFAPSIKIIHKFWIQTFMDALDQMRLRCKQNSLLRAVLKSLVSLGCQKKSQLEDLNETIQRKITWKSFKSFSSLSLRNKKRSLKESIWF